MNLEAILATISKLADSINNHADAIRETAGANVAATKDTGSVGKAETAPAKTEKADPAAKTEVKEDPNREVYWKHENGQYGKCTISEFRKMHKEDDQHSLTDPDTYKALCAEAKKREKDNQAAAEKARKAKEAADAKKKAEAEEAASDDVTDGPAGEITDEDLGALIRPFAAVETPSERTRRTEWLRTLFSRFGAKRASEVAQANRGELVAIVEKAIEAVVDDEGADLPDIEGDMSDLV